MNFADILRKTGTFTRTENGAVALNTTGDACLATKIAFYAFHPN